MADISRNHYAEDRGVIRKVLQQGRHVVDADWNEQMDALKMIDRRALSALLRHTSYRFGDGFKIVGTGANLSLTIKAGRAALQIASEAAVMLSLASDYTLTGFSSFPGGGRTDYIYVDLHEDEISAATDPDIVCPSLGQESCVDVRLAFDFRISQGGVPGAAPTGHTYIILGSVTGTDSELAADEVVNSIANYWDPTYFDLGGLNLLRNGSFELWYDGDGTYYYRARHWTDTFPGYAYGSDGGTRELSVIRGGTYSARFTAGHTANQGYLCQIVPDVKRYRGRKIRASVWVTCDGTAVSGNKTISLKITDGINTTTGNAVILSAAGTWVEAVVEHTIAANATSLALGIMSGLSVGSWPCFADDACLYIGPAPRSFEPNPQDGIDAYDVALDSALAAVELPLYCHTAQSHTDADALQLSDASIRHLATAANGVVTRTVIRLPYVHLTAYRTLILRCEGYADASAVTAEVRLKCGAGSVASSINFGSATRQMLQLDLSSLGAGNTTDITVEISVNGTSQNAYVQRVQIAVRLAV